MVDVYGHGPPQLRAISGLVSFTAGDPINYMWISLLSEAENKFLFSP